MFKGVLYYVKKSSVGLELAKWIMFTFNEQFLILKIMIGCVEHRKGKCHMSFSLRVIYMKQSRNTSEQNNQASLTTVVWKERD